MTVSAAVSPERDARLEGERRPLEAELSRSVERGLHLESEVSAERDARTRLEQELEGLREELRRLRRELELSLARSERVELPELLLPLDVPKPRPDRGADALERRLARPRSATAGRKELEAHSSLTRARQTKGSRGAVCGLSLAQ